MDFNLINHTFIGDAWVTESGAIEMRGTLALDMFMSSKLEAHLSAQLRAASSAEPLDFSATNYEYAITELAGVEVAKNAVGMLNRDGGFKKVPKEIKYSVVLTNLEFHYDKFEDSFISTSRIGVATLGDRSVFRSVPGRVELVRGRGRDVLRLYFHISENHWYYFEYDTFFNFETNDLTFMEVWNKLKASEKRLNDPETDRSVKMQVSRSGLRDDFVDRFRDFD
jgi:hypothetical protein